MKSAVKDPVTKKYVATCECGYRVERSKREAAEHVMSQHVSYTHGDK